jgi:hypothetical protein
MLKNTTYKEKFAMLASWMTLIVDSVKKDIKNEHLKKDVAFVRQYFSGKNFNKLSTQELAQAYGHAIANGENGEELAEFVSNRWLLKHSDLYHHFEQELSKIDPNFSDLEVMPKEPSIAIMEKAVQQFGAPQTYLFCVLNSVVFPEDVYKILSNRAEHHVKESITEAEAQKEQLSVENMKKNYEQQIARVTDKYEKKLSGLQKKYVHDVDGLKKQIATLQRKLNVS